MIISLDTQIHLYSVDTEAFFTDEELVLSKKITDAKKEQNKINELLNNSKQPITAKEKQELEQDYKIHNKVIKDTKKQLKELFKNNYGKGIVRELREEKLNIHNIISMFTSTLTRTLQLPVGETTTDLFVVEVYYFSVAQSLIENGFVYSGEKYRCFTASAGQIRTKKVVFIKESLWEKHRLSLMCGLSLDDINNQGGINTNKFLSYLALTNSATDYWQDFNIDKCIVVDDFKTLVNGDVDFINEKDYSITRQNMDIEIEHTDGCGMILPSVTNNNKNFMIRLPWIKGLLSPFDFKEFIKYNIKNGAASKIKDIYGKEYDIFDDDIQIIFTKSQFKLWRYYRNWDEYKFYFKKHQCQAGVCNIEDDFIKNTHINYQMLQTLTNITQAEIRQICKKSLDKLEKTGKDLRYLFNTFCTFRSSDYKHPIQEALEIYPELFNDSYFKKIITDTQNALIKQYKSGKLRIGGKSLYIIPDLYAACQYWFMKISKPAGLLADGEVACNIYHWRRKVGCLRSPHLYREWAVRNVKTNQRTKKWFITNGLYTSSHDLISKMLQFDE